MVKQILKTDETLDAVSITSNVECQTDYSGSLDFAFVVHARTIEDTLQAHPNLRGNSEEIVLATVRPKSVHVIGYIHVGIGGRLLRGELISIPQTAEQFRCKLPEIREALRLVLNYCSRRKTKIVGLGGLLPSVTRHGLDLLSFVDGVGITTGHSYTAHVIAEQVRAVEQKIGAVTNLAILGAAGSMGQAITRLLCADDIARKITLIDVHAKLGVLRDVASELKSRRLVHIEITSELSALKKSSVIVCVTNSPSALIRAEHLSPGCIVIDDAQPPNITFEVAKAAGVTVLKCLASVPNLKCPFDFGLFPTELLPAKQSIVFTCLAETIMLAANKHEGHFTIGHPTDAQLKTIAEFSRASGISIAPFHSFPEIGEVEIFKRT
jgi:fatty aldehyde-generating acyl-ACP reductase